MPKPTPPDAERQTTSIWLQALNDARVAAAMENKSMTDFVSEAVTDKAQAVFRKRNYKPSAPALAGAK